MVIRIGFGYDAHRLVKSRPLILGGIEIEWELGLEGHSDADVIAHAIIDALLGAAGKGDIGRLFPDSDPKYKDISSVVLLSKTAKILRSENFSINNVDVTLVAQRPKISPYVGKMQARIASALEVEKGVVNIKATTTEGMGFCGTEQGMAAYAVVTLKTI